MGMVGTNRELVLDRDSRPARRRHPRTLPALRDWYAWKTSGFSTTRLIDIAGART
jgi:hypothetical protein